MPCCKKVPMLCLVSKAVAREHEMLLSKHHQTKASTSLIEDVALHE
ncbi:hypothetical protein MtrunA17_Chr3g0081351 [Medicago truncatula]|uniref:Uncharacterized protein n=1 Tax=Medicago truncatula TaxID=3880 RepID=A0A396IMK3_MEDTR|nr:hypothetical protein MtrunA17_Chr3g0081351 [Medicago truncatula]